MKTLKETEKEFDKEFPIIPIGEEVNDRLYRSRERMKRECQKKFYRQAFAELMSEVVGEDGIISAGGNVVPKELRVKYNFVGISASETSGYNQAKAEIRKRMKQMLA